MSKFVNIPNGNYKLSVQPGGDIILNTGEEIGRVVVTGDLLVEGNTTTVKSEELTVKDNIINLNEGETGAGISLNESGIRINRGTFVDAYFVFDEDITWRDPSTETTQSGGFVFKNHDNELVGLRANSISTGGGDLYLINSGTGVISVTGTTDYELYVTDDDHITNKKYVDDTIEEAFTVYNITVLRDGYIDPTSVAVKDEESTGLNSTIEFTVDSTLVGAFTNIGFSLTDIKIVNNEMSTIELDTDLILKSPGISSVRINDSLHIDSLADIDNPLSQPLTPTQGVKIYSAAESSGKTGLFFVNADSTRDELISKNRAIIYSLIF